MRISAFGFEIEKLERLLSALLHAAAFKKVALGISIENLTFIGPGFDKQGRPVLSKGAGSEEKHGERRQNRALGPDEI